MQNLCAKLESEEEYEISSLVYLMFITGLRPSDILLLKFNDFNINNNLVSLRKRAQKTKKYINSTIIPPNLWEKLLKIKDSGKLDDELIFDYSKSILSSFQKITN